MYYSLGFLKFFIIIIFKNVSTFTLHLCIWQMHLSKLTNNAFNKYILKSICQMHKCNLNVLQPRKCSKSNRKD